MSLTEAQPSGRPPITLAIRHFNNAPFVAAALEAAFAQTYSPLEILVIDDCSTDGGFEIARSMVDGYTGQHRAVLARNERNLGVGGQIMRIRDLAKGEIVVFADADDISLPPRCERIYQAFRDGGPELLGVISYFDFIDAGGDRIDSAAARLSNYREPAENWTPVTLLQRGGMTGAVLALRRHILEIGVSLAGLRLGEDQVLGFRCAILGRLKTIPEVLVLRRVHRDNLSASVRTDWSAAECKERFANDMREAVLIPCFMRRDLGRFERDGLVSADRAAPVYQALALNMRKLKILRVVSRLSAVRAWMSVCDLRRVGASFRDSLRLILPVVAPRLEVMRMHRHTRRLDG